MSQTPSQPVAQQSAEVEVDEFAIQMKQLRKKQKPTMAIGAGILASIVTTALWLLIAQKYQVSWMALAIGFGTAYSIQYAGKIVDQWYGFVAAFLTLAGILFATIITAINIFSKVKHVPKSDIIAQLDFSMAVSFISALMRPIDVLLFLGSIFAAFWFSFKHVQRPMP